MTRACVVLVMMLGACSFAAVRSPTLNGEGRRVDPNEACTESYAAPVVDTLTAGPLAGIGAALLMQPEMKGSFVPDLRGLVAGMFLVPAVLYAASAVYGYATVHACRSPIEEMSAGDTAPQRIEPGALPLPVVAPKPRVRD